MHTVYVHVQCTVCYIHVPMAAEKHFKKPQWLGKVHVDKFSVHECNTCTCMYMYLCMAGG